MIDKNLTVKCPLCLSTQNFYLSNYPGSFLSCKSLYKCEKCELIFANKIPSKDELDKYYSSGLYYDFHLDPFDRNFFDFSKNLSLARLNLINNKTNILKKNCKVMDLGAGNASFGIKLKSLVDKAIYETVEPDKKISKQYGDWVNNNFNSIDNVKSCNYDLVVLNQVLEHVPNPIEFLKSVCIILRRQGFIFIDIPFQDYLFKTDVGPHILFWNEKSINFLIEEMGLKLIFCDTAGMSHKKAKHFFKKSSLFYKMQNIFFYERKINHLLEKIGLPQFFNTFENFSANKYGGQRIWLRCIAQKIV